MEQWGNSRFLTFSFFLRRDQYDSVDEDSPRLSGSSLAASSGDSSEMKVNPSLAQAKVAETSSHPPLTYHVGEGVNASMAEVQTLAMEGQAMDQGQEIPRIHENPASVRPASPAHVVLESCDQQEMPPPSTTNGGAPSTSLSPCGNREAELAERRRVAEAALTSHSILLKQRALLSAALSQFRSAKAGIMEVFLGLAKGFEVR